MKGLGANLGRDLRVRKVRLLADIQVLDARADSVGLLDDEWIMRFALEDELTAIYCQEEIYWRQQGTVRWVLFGDANTAYFQAIAIGRRRRCSIPLLWDGDILLQSVPEIRTHVDSFYKDMFSNAPSSGV